MQKKLRSLYTDPLYRNSIALMLNSGLAVFFGIVFWIVAAQVNYSPKYGLCFSFASDTPPMAGLVNS